MPRPKFETLRLSWEEHHRRWRDPAGIAAQWEEAGRVDPRLLEARARGPWRELLGELGVTLVVSREYEHLLVALNGTGRHPSSFFSLPHPSGMAYDPAGRLWAASSRNPNQIFELRPVTGLQKRTVRALGAHAGRPLVPRRSFYFPGCLYLHDLAMLGGRLHASAVGQNAVIRVEEDGTHRAVWRPRCVEKRGRAAHARNEIQLNSIAAGRDLASSFFSASCERPGRFRPGHPRFPVDGRGVIFSGATREPAVRGLTRPHSARLHRGALWIANSGYGEFGRAESGLFQPLCRLPGWTRGVAFAGKVAFVGVSRVIPRFRQYAPGLDMRETVCGVFAVDLKTGRRLASLVWPYGYQIFAIEAVPAAWASGFPFAGRRNPGRELELFYAYQTNGASCA